VDKYETVISVDFLPAPDPADATPLVSLLMPFLLFFPVLAMWLQKRINN
jgi:hypothetical protein